MKLKTNVLILPIGIVIIVLLYLNLKKAKFESITRENEDIHDNTYRPGVFTNKVVPAQKNNEIITKSFLTNLISEYSNHFNANGGANTNVKQNKYDLIFKDIVISSEKRNVNIFPNPNSYSLKLNINMDKIYKAELIDVYVPAATDDAVNIPTNGNRLYFSYTNLTITTVGYIVILAGTYFSPVEIGNELTRQFGIVLTLAGFDLTNSTIGIVCNYDKNLNRYVFSDLNSNDTGTFIIYPKNGYIIDSTSIVTNSITDYLMLNYTNDNSYISGPKYINSIDNVLYVDTASPGDYGEYSDTFVPLTSDPQFSNCIMSDVVLTNCKLFLSLGKLNGDTCNIVPDQTGNNIGNVPPVFCQIPNNTTVSSRSVKTLLNQPHNYSSIQFYNPPLSKLNKLDIKWYTDTGELVRILNHCFTIRIYYFQKRMDTTDFSFPIP
jgi:hypothetical protein